MKPEASDKESIISNARDFVTGLFRDEYSGHDASHTFRTAALASRLAREEGADEFVVTLAALLHDVDDVKLSPETAEDLSRASEFMRGNGLDESLISTVCAIIRSVGFKGSDSVVPDSIEGKCVQDADRLDAIGAVGIARAFAYGGSRARPMHDPETPPRLNMNEAEYRSSRSTSVNHFYEKLFLLKDMMNTASAKRIAEARDGFMRDFIDEFLAEWAGER